jgi:hypothetical protein
VSRVVKEHSAEKKHAFSIELESIKCVKCVLILNESNDCVLIEGYLGGLEEMGLIDGVMLEIKGTYGTYRMDLNEEEMIKLLNQRCTGIVE